MAASICVFTSAQAETACRTKPPMALGVSSELVPQARVARNREAARKERRVCRPASNVRSQTNNKTLNVIDLPEALMPAAGRPLPKTLPLPVLSEDGEVEDNIIQAVPHEANLEWACQVCTFVNCGLLQHCEMCNTEKGVTQPLEECAANTSVPLKFNDDWPSLDGAVDAWETCEISSIASSWLDIGDMGEDLEGVDFEDGVVLLGYAPVSGHAPPEVLSWSARVAMTASKADSSKTPCAHIMLPSAWHRPSVKQQHRNAIKVAKDEEDVQDVALDILEERRLQSRASRGMAQRQRARKK
jgi:hypothetical protein